ncbi:MAG: Holliday junction branch migration protein RuvA [Saccharofermentanales bacterium]
MYAFLNGIIAYKKADNFVIDVNGIGYKIFCAPALLDRIPSQGEQAKVYTYMVVREDAISLYGFPTQDELSMFEMLLTVSGIGPKVAGTVAAHIEPSRFAMAILASDVGLISSVKGVGKKGAERIILELKDKLKGISFNDDSRTGVAATTGIRPGAAKYSEACSALVVLGYSANEANKVITRVYNEKDGIEDIIKSALRELLR